METKDISYDHLEIAIKIKKMADEHLSEFEKKTGRLENKISVDVDRDEIVKIAAFYDNLRFLDILGTKVKL